MDLKALISTEADHCVKCGLCLPHCPTYLKSRNEGDSPRGRIALLQGLAAGQLPDSESLRHHLDGCLNCRACEHVCPSSVAYGQLLDAGRSLLWSPEDKDKLPLSDQLLTQPRKTARLLRLYQGSGLQRLARASGLTRRLGVEREDSYIPPLPRQRLKRNYYPARGQQVGEVGLFTGCGGWIFDQGTLAAAVQLLTDRGYSVHVPSQQQCCGALHLHRGDRQQARALAAANVACFNKLPLDAVIYTASACGVMLQEYATLEQLVAGDPLQFHVPPMEISHFLTSCQWPADAFHPLDGGAILHDPCSLRHVLKGSDAVQQLLRRIPRLKLTPLADNPLCCGAAGDYMFQQPAMADTLLADKIESLRRQEARLLLTSNIGCALHLRRGIREAGLNIEVLHPVQLLAKLLRK